jgi:hypothetical protein
MEIKYKIIDISKDEFYVIGKNDCLMFDRSYKVKVSNHKFLFINIWIIESSFHGSLFCFSRNSATKESKEEIKEYFEWCEKQEKIDKEIKMWTRWI